MTHVTLHVTAMSDGGNARYVYVIDSFVTQTSERNVKMFEIPRQKRTPVR